MAVVTHRVTSLFLKHIEYAWACTHSTICLELNKFSISELLWECSSQKDHQVEQLEPAVQITIKSVQDRLDCVARQTRLCHISWRSKQRLDLELNAPSLSLVIIVWPSSWRLRTPLNQDCLSKNEELMAPDRGQASSELKVSSKVIVQIVRVLLTSDHELAIVTGDGGSLIDLN